MMVIRGGGHTRWAGAANIDAGVTVDLQNITGVNYDLRTNLFSIELGERCAAVYSTLEVWTGGVAGGRVSKVGVAGLTAGASSLDFQHFDCS